MSSIWQGCVGRWSLAGGQTTDYSGNNNTLKVTGSPTVVAGLVSATANAALFFSGTGQYLSIGNLFQKGLNITGEMSLFIRFKASALGTVQMLVSKLYTSGHYCFDAYIDTSKKLNFRLSSNGTALINAIGATTLTNGTVYDALCVYNATDMRVYILGSLDTNGSSNPKAYTSGIFAGTDDFAVAGTAQGNNLLTSVVQDIAIWARDLSSTECAALHAMGDSFALNIPDFQGQNDATINFGKAVVSTSYGSSDTSIVLNAGMGAKFPKPSTAPFNLVWWNSTDYADPSDDPNVEIVRCTAISTDTLTVTRAQEGTSASTKNTSGKTYKMILAATKKMMSDISTKIDGAINVKSAAYGAKGNGVTDDTAAILAAINDAPTSAGLRTIYFPPGIYLISSVFTINILFLKLMGAGMFLSTIKYLNGVSSGVNNLYMFTVQSDGVTFQDMSFDGNMDNNTAIATTGAVEVTGNDFTLLRCGVMNFTYFAVLWYALKTSLTGFTVEKCYFRNCGYNWIYLGVAPTTGAYLNNIKIIDNRFLYCQEGGIQGSSVQNVIVRGNFFDRSQQSTNQTVTYTGGFIRFAGEYYPTGNQWIANFGIITENICWNNVAASTAINDGSAIVLDNSSSSATQYPWQYWAYGWSIHANIIGMISERGIVADGAGLSIDGNFFYNCGVAAVGMEAWDVSAPRGPISITGNTMMNAGTLPNAATSTANGCGMVMLWCNSGTSSLGEFCYITVTGNTLISVSGAGTPINYGFWINNQAGLTGNLFYNITVVGNDFSTATTSGVQLTVSPATLTNFICENNLVPDPVKTLAVAATPNIQGSPSWKTANAQIATLSTGYISLSQTAGGTIAATTYYARVTAVDALGGETLASTELSHAVPANDLLVVNMNTASLGANATGWNVYVSTSTGTETKQNASPIAISTGSWTEPTSGLISGAALPTANTTQTVITNLVGGYTGQRTYLWIQDSHTTLAFSTGNLKGNGGINRFMTSGDLVEGWYDGTNWHCLISPVAQAVQTLTVNSATPSVQSGASTYQTANTSATTITTFAQGLLNQEITVLINDANTTLNFSTGNLKGNGSANRAMNSGDSIFAVYDGTNWRCFLSTI